MLSQCARGHPIKGSQDIYESRHCKQCQRRHSADYRRRASAALKVVDAILTEQPIPPDAAQTVVSKHCEDVTDA